MMSIERKEYGYILPRQSILAFVTTELHLAYTMQNVSTAW